MKKFNLTFVFCLTVYFLSAQDYLITFSGKGESTSVSTVIVENMTQGKSLTLNGNETLHLKNDVTKISDLEYNQTDGIQFYPNPMKEFSIMEFAMPGEGAVKIELFDISGRKLTQTHNYLNQGRHSYRISGIRSGIYVLKVTAGNYSYSGKLISNKKTGEVVNIKYQNTIPFSDNPKDTKSANSEILLQYNTGDLLKFFATGGEHKSVKVDVISESKNIDFEFYKCTDPDNRNYATVKIGNQIWMAENLAYLPEVSPSGYASPGSSTEPYYYVYGYTGTDVAAAKDDQNYKDYGVLYNWPAALSACPLGWHLPSDDEWTALTTWLGGESMAGDNMKATSGWYDNGNGTNTSGFSALPGGYSYHTFLGMSCSGVTYSGHWWSSTEDTVEFAWGRHLDYNDSSVGRSGYDGRTVSGYSVRCVKDSVPPNTFTDPRDNKTYKTVKIGNQEWMAENLAYLPEVSPASISSTTLPYYYVYGYEGTDVAAAKATSNYNTYGVLYNWTAAKAACPPGWHLASDDEWKQMEMDLGMTQAQVDATGWRGIDQGTQMKATSGWSNSGNGTNSSGFAALPAGNRLGDGMSGVGDGGVWWSSTKANTSGAWGRGMNYIYGNVYRDYIGKEDGFSVRCVRDN